MHARPHTHTHSLTDFFFRPWTSYAESTDTHKSEIISAELLTQMIGRCIVKALMGLCCVCMEHEVQGTLPQLCRTQQSAQATAAAQWGWQKSGGW